MKLHEAIELVIIEKGIPLTPNDIAQIINDRKLYIKGDGSKVTGQQISTRVKSYNLLFSQVNGLISTKDPDRTRVLAQNIIRALRSLPDNQSFFLIVYLLLLKQKNPNHIYSWFDDPFDVKGDMLQSLGDLGNFPIFDDLAELIMQYDQKTFSLILNLVTGIQFESRQQLIDVFAKVVQSHFTLEWYTPINLSRYIASIPIFSGLNSLYDPFAGSAMLVTAMAEHYPDSEYVLRDINRRAVLLGTLTLLSHDVKTFSYELGNSLREPAGSKFDFIVSAIPSGVRFTNKEITEFAFPLLITTLRSEDICLQYILFSLSDKGKAAVVVPDSLLFNNDASSLALRRLLIEKDWIEQVHRIPGTKHLQSSISDSSVLVINKAKPNELREKVIFKLPTTKELEDLKSDSAAAITIGAEQIITNDYVLSANSYVHRKPEDNKWNAKVADVIIDHKRGRRIDKQALSSNGEVPYITIKHLSNHKKNIVLNVAKVDTFVDTRQVDDVEYLKKDSVLLAIIGERLKPTLFRDDQPATISNNILAVTVDESKIRKEYFIIQLNEWRFRAN